MGGSWRRETLGRQSGQTVDFYLRRKREGNAAKANLHQAMVLIGGIELAELAQIAPDRNLHQNRNGPPSFRRGSRSRRCSRMGLP